MSTGKKIETFGFELHYKVLHKLYKGVKTPHSVGMDLRTFP